MFGCTMGYIMGACFDRNRGAANKLTRGARLARFAQGKSLDELTDMLANCELGSVQHSQVTAELTLMQIHMQTEALEAQRLAAEAEMKAANAAESAAKAARANLKYMLWSVLVAAASTAITAAGIAFNIFAH